MVWAGPSTAGGRYGLLVVPPRGVPRQGSVWRRPASAVSRLAPASSRVSRVIIYPFGAPQHPRYTRRIGYTLRRIGLSAFEHARSAESIGRDEVGSARVRCVRYERVSRHRTPRHCLTLNRYRRATLRLYSLHSTFSERRRSGRSPRVHGAPPCAAEPSPRPRKLASQPPSRR